MRVLGIETSCDETSVALLTVERGVPRVAAHLTASQVATHRKYGGVVPEVAARMHVETLPKILKKLGLAAKDVDGIAVTRGPGLITSLRVGIDFARALAYGWKKPLVGVNHVEGHIMANFIGSRERAAFPAIVLVVSGGHTEIILMRGFGEYERLGATLDDAAGEAFDKVAKMLGLGYPGGPTVSKRAEKGDRAHFALPRPLLDRPGFDFSFSGLKTAVLHTVERRKTWTAEEVGHLCASFEEAVVETLVAKTLRAAKTRAARTVFLAGGVAANRRLRERLAAGFAEALPDARVVLPDLAYCTDNAAMIAMAGWSRLSKGERHAWETMEPDPSWELGI